MRVTTGLRIKLLATALAGAAPGGGAQAATFLFTSGNYQPGITSPNPLLAPDVLNISSGANKFFSGVTFVNQTGMVEWSDGAIFLQNNGIVDNRSLWNTTGDNVIASNGGATLFANSGTFRKSAGAGVTTISSIVFTNSGTIDAQTGRIVFSGNQNSFTAGSSFTGAGIVSIGGNSTFGGAIASQNLDFDNGTYSGDAAVLSGTADMRAGTFTGGWEITAGSTLSALGGANKFWSGADFTNNGTVDWQQGALFLQSGAAITNAGLWNATGDDSIVPNGGTVSFVNDGVFRKSGGTGPTTVNAIGFVNNGTIDALTGTIAFVGNGNVFNAGTAFTGAGAVAISGNSTFNGAFTTANLDFNNGIYGGNAAALTGAADFRAGTFSGGWEMTAGSTLSALGGANKFVTDASFTNDGTIDWQQGALFLQGATQLTNNGVFAFTSSTSVVNNGGPATLTNTGLFRADAGAIVTVQNRFVNAGGTITADGGMVFTGGNARFEDGTVFDGAGSNRVVADAAFAGGIAASNLSLDGGTYTGEAATLNGLATWTAGAFSGSWTLAPATVLTVTGGSNKFVNGGSVTNNGTVVWDQGALFLQSGATVANAGTIDVRTDNGVYDNGGAAGFVNTGLIQKTAGTGTATFGNAIGFSNLGTIDVRSGTIALPTNFANAGTLTGTGTFAVAGTLTNNGIVAPGNGIGTLTLNGGYAQTALGRLNIQLSSGGLSDLFAINGAATLGGTLALSCFSCGGLMAGDLFTLLDASGDLSGLFGDVTTSGFRSGFAFDVTYDLVNDRVQLLVTDAGTAGPGAVPEPSTWAMLLIGFGLTGAAIRRRRGVAAVAA